MSESTSVFNGVVHGTTIELEQRPDLPDGQPVTVTVQPAAQSQRAEVSPFEALKRAAGSWSDDVKGLDEFLDWNRQQRKTSRREIPE
ncbi:MAG TPA: hypothetical protein VMV69_04245 [Pirellulales bacterium]|nr:hypothetical protein [Pirellulales bacterium]